MTIKYSIIFVSIFTLLLLFANISNVNNLNVFAQNSTNSTAASTTSKTNSGLKITHPEKESAISTNSSNPFIVKGTSKDNATADCKVSIIINNVKPYQPVQALGVNGKEDYSNWQYVLSKNYTNIIQGSNKITAKSSCLNDSPQNTYYSVNVTGMGPEQFKNYNQTTSTLNNVSSLATIDPQQHPVALEIQNIIKGSPGPSQFAFVADNNNTNQDLNGNSPALNNTTPLVSNSTGLNSTAFGLNSYSVVPVVSNNTTFGSNNTTPLVSNSTGLNSTAFGLNSYSVVPVVSSSTGLNSTGLNSTGLNSTGLNSTGLNSTGLNSTAFGLNSYSVVPVVSNSTIPVVTNTTLLGVNSIKPASPDSSGSKSDGSKSDGSKSNKQKDDKTTESDHTSNKDKEITIRHIVPVETTKVIFKPSNFNDNKDVKQDNKPAKDHTGSSSKNTFNFSPFTTATTDNTDTSIKDVKKDKQDNKPAKDHTGSSSTGSRNTDDFDSIGNNGNDLADNIINHVWKNLADNGINMN